MESDPKTKSHSSLYLIPIMLVFLLILLRANNVYEDPFEITGFKERLCTNEKILTSLISESEDGLKFVESCQSYVACDELDVNLKKIALVNPKAYTVLGEMFEGKEYAKTVSETLNCELNSDPALATLYYREAQKNDVPNSGSRLKEVCSTLDGLDKLKASVSCNFYE